MVAGAADLVFELIKKHAIECDAVQNGWLQPAHRASRKNTEQKKHDQRAARGAPVAKFDAETAAA